MVIDMENLFAALLLFAQQLPAGEAAPTAENRTLLMGGVAAAAALVAILVLWRALRRKPVVENVAAPNLRVDIAALSTGGPPRGKPYLEFYSVPVRLAAIVVAPVGRDGHLPSNEHLPLVMEAILPGLMKVLAAHQPQFIRWPAQLSSQGFAHSFFNNVPLPGDHGRGTPWCSVSGKVELSVGQFLVGLVCSAAEANSLGETTIKHAAGWPDVIRVKG